MTPFGSNLYETLGGAGRLRALVHCFVDDIDALPAGNPLRGMFEGDLRRFELRLFEFLSGWLGGPPLYTQQHGLPNLRARHRHLAIGNAERDQWLQCMRRALAANTASQDVRERLDLAFWNMANSLRNRDDRPAAGGRSEAPPAAIAPRRARPQPGLPSKDAT
jgi:hemoglobin